MFTIDQIKAAHSKVKTGADFPQYVQDLIALGVESYETYVSNGNTIYRSHDGEIVSSGAKYDGLAVNADSNAEQFIRDLRTHQQGGTNYPTFCSDCAKSGVEKWKVSMTEMTCTYSGQNGQVMLAENIPSV